MTRNTRPDQKEPMTDHEFAEALHLAVLFGVGGAVVVLAVAIIVVAIVQAVS